MPDRLEDVTGAISELEDRAKRAVEAAEQDSTKIGEMQSFLENTVKPEMKALEAQRAQAITEKELDELKGSHSTLQAALEELRAPAPDFDLGGEGEGKAMENDPYREGGSVFADVVLANRGNAAAIERLNKDLPQYKGVNFTAEGKAMTEGTNAQGGYLVRPQIERRLVEAKEADNKLRNLCSKINISTNQLQLDQLGLSTVAGWVAELAAKPETTGVTLATITASVFTAAGLATISNQLLADSDPAVDGLVTRDLSKRLTALEETAFLTGSGTNQPLGLLNTPGLSTTPLTLTTVEALLGALLDAIANVEEGHDAPSALLMHPRTWTRILKSKDAQGFWTVSSQGEQSNSVTEPRTLLRGPQKTLFGYPVVTSNRIPTNLGAGTNESRIIVGDFEEALILDRQGITVDESPHVYFTTNQTVFRAEMRVGFTAARTPAAFNVIGGAGLAGG